MLHAQYSQPNELRQPSNKRNELPVSPLKLVRFLNATVSTLSVAHGMCVPAGCAISRQVMETLHGSKSATTVYGLQGGQKAAETAGSAHSTSLHSGVVNSFSVINRGSQSDGPTRLICDGDVSKKHPVGVDAW